MGAEHKPFLSIHLFFVSFRYRLLIFKPTYSEPKFDISKNYTTGCNDIG